jgi:hypothetical protein
MRLYQLFDKDYYNSHLPGMSVVISSRSVAIFFRDKHHKYVTLSSIESERATTMARKKLANPFLIAARTYISLHVPELQAAPLHLRMLDSLPGSPSCAVTAEACLAGDCPNGIAASVAESGGCTVRDCPLRCSVRLLLNRHAMVMQATRSGVHWN